MPDEKTILMSGHGQFKLRKPKSVAESCGIFLINFSFRLRFETQMAWLLSEMDGLKTYILKVEKLNCLRLSKVHDVAMIVVVVDVIFLDLCRSQILVISIQVISIWGSWYRVKKH